MPLSRKSYRAPDAEVPQRLDVIILNKEVEILFRVNAKGNVLESLDQG